MSSKNFHLFKRQLLLLQIHYCATPADRNQVHCGINVNWSTERSSPRGLKHHSSQIHIETYQLVRNQFLLISLIMCHQHHQWNELVCLKQNQVCIHCPSFLDEHFSSTKRGRKRKKGRRRRGGGWGGVIEGRDCSEGGNAGKTTSGGAGISPFTGIWLVFPLCKNNNKKIQNKRKFKMVL